MLEVVGIEITGFYNFVWLYIIIANMILKFGVPVNILKADTKNVGGIAKGEMILGLPEGHELQEQIKAYMVEKGLEIEEVTQYV